MVNDIIKFEENGGFSQLARRWSEITRGSESWSIEQLDNAIAAIRSGAKLRAAARNVGIPESTMRDNSKLGNGNDDEATAQPADETRSLRRNPLFTEQQEQEIADHVVTLGNLLWSDSSALMAHSF
ncbi:hypothetical protein JTB14_031538 [Gonioctena quinquepunctata]|nr:hypothetical protein JTB14_031538 [Gonioctena quinquepunctata]